MKKVVMEMFKKLSLLGVAAVVMGMMIFGVVGRGWSQSAPNYPVRHQVRLAGQTANDWKATQAAKPGDKLEWTVDFQNLSSDQLDDVTVSDKLDQGLSVVPGSIKLYNSNFTGGYTMPDNLIQANGAGFSVNIGAVGVLPQADRDQGLVSAQLIFATAVAAPAPDVCGQQTLTSKADLTPKGKPAVSATATAVVDTGKACGQPETPKPEEPKPEPKSDQASYECTTVTVTKLDNQPHAISVKVKATTSGGALIKRYTYDFGDGKTPLVTDRDQVDSYVYEKDGTYAVRVKTEFTVNGETKTDTANHCVAPITFGSSQTTPPAVQAATTGKGDDLPNTGPGTTVAVVFAITTIASVLAYQMYARVKGYNV